MAYFQVINLEFGLRVRLNRFEDLLDRHGAKSVRPTSLWKYTISKFTGRWLDRNRTNL